MLTQACPLTALVEQAEIREKIFRRKDQSPQSAWDTSSKWPRRIHAADDGSPGYWQQSATEKRCTDLLIPSLEGCPESSGTHGGPKEPATSQDTVGMPSRVPRLRLR